MLSSMASMHASVARTSAVPMAAGDRIVVDYQWLGKVFMRFT
ncbi:2-keto-4-pentenoate hydratase [Oxalobacteraceae bacterium GrIS 1.11]